MDFKNPKQATEFLQDSIDAYQPVANALMVRVSVDRCMYEGVQWISSRGDFYRDATIGRRLSNWNPDTNKLVATVNRIPPLIRESAAASFPEKIEFMADPPERDMGIQAASNAQVLESAANILTDETGYLKAARDANFRRCIDGTHGIGWCLKRGSRSMKLRNGGEYEEEEHSLEAFTFDPTQLVLDPFNQSQDLWDHDWVIHRRVWTSDAIERTFGVKFDDDDLSTVGDLCSLEMKMNKLSENRLYANLPQYSKTKGAIVYQKHYKSGGDRFDRMLVGIKPARSKPGEEIRWINFEEPESPFGGNGLPLMLLHGARRADSMFSMSDVFLMKDDQDRINLLSTFTFRMLQHNAGFQWLVPVEAMPGKDIDNFRNQFTNRVAGLIEYKAGTKDRPVPPPQIVQTPPPQPFVNELASMYEQSQRKMVHRHEVTTGATKSHVPDSTYQAALQQAGQVLGNRIREDIQRHEAMMLVGLGTAIKLAQEGNASTLAMFRRGGFDEQDFSAIAEADWRYPSCRLKMRESSIRYQSKEEKEQRMWAAVQAQAMSPLKLRIALADMDIPLDDSDKAMSTAARKAALRVLLGEMWEPVMLGEYSEMFIAEFRRARFDRRAQLDPVARQRLDIAIEMQLAYTNMEIQQAAMAQQPPTAPASTGQPAEPQAEMPKEVSIVDLLSQIESGVGTGSSGQPVAA